MSEQIDDWLDGGIIVDDGLVVPRGGWDNTCDIPAAKAVVRDTLGVITAGPKGLDKIGFIAGQLYDLGISPDLAADLIFSIQNPPHHREEIRAAVHHFYGVVVGPGPGLRSKALPREDEWTPPDEDDDSWLEGGPAVWPKPLQYD